jgi:hypothetical protein
MKATSAPHKQKVRHKSKNRITKATGAPRKQQAHHERNKLATKAK